MICLCLNLTACGKDEAKEAADKVRETVQKTAETAKETAESAKNTAVSVKDSVLDWYAGLDIGKFKEGFNSSVTFLGDAYRMVMDGEEIEEVAETVKNLKETMSEASGTAKEIGEALGPMAKKWAGSFDISVYTGPPSLKAQAEAREIIKVYNEYILNRMGSVSLKEFLDEQGDRLETEALYEALYKGKTDAPVIGDGTPLSEIITPKYVLNQATGSGTDGQKKLLNAALSMGPDIYSVIKEAALRSGMNEEELKEKGIEAAIAESDGFIEGAVSRIIASLCKEGGFGEELMDASAAVIGTLTVLTIKGSINGYALAKGEITAEDYGNLMADDLMISMMSLPSIPLLLAILPATRIVMLAGCMAGGIAAGAGFLLAKDAVLDIVDGGGFEAILPAETVDQNKDIVRIAKDTIASMNLKDRLSNLKDTLVTTGSDGKITVSLGTAED